MAIGLGTYSSNDDSGRQRALRMLIHQRGIGGRERFRPDVVLRHPREPIIFQRRNPGVDDRVQSNIAGLRQQRKAWSAMLETEQIRGPGGAPVPPSLISARNSMLAEIIIVLEGIPALLPTGHHALFQRPGLIRRIVQTV